MRLQGTALHISVVCASVAGVITAPALGAETECYEYDVYGRLIEVTQSGPDNSCAITGDNSTVVYEYDDADNRTKEQSTNPTQ